MPHIKINFYDNVILRRQQSDEFNFINFTQEEVLECFLNVKSNAVGYDGMHPKFLKKLYYLIHSPTSPICLIR